MISRRTFLKSTVLGGSVIYLPFVVRPRDPPRTPTPGRTATATAAPTTTVVIGGARYGTATYSSTYGGP